MSELNSYRMQINDLDKKIQELIDQRFEISQKVGEYKKINNIEITNRERELEILNNISTYTYNTEIKQIYEQIFILSKRLQQ